MTAPGARPRDSLTAFRAMNVRHVIVSASDVAAAQYGGQLGLPVHYVGEGLLIYDVPQAP